jgi:hypothetical protein
MHYYLFKIDRITGGTPLLEIGRADCAWNAFRAAFPEMNEKNTDFGIRAEFIRFKDLGPAKPVLPARELACMGGPSSWDRLFFPGEDVVKIGAQGLTADKHDAAVRLIVSGMAHDRIAGVLGLRLAQIEAIAGHVRRGDYDDTRADRRRRIEECFAALET